MQLVDHTIYSVSIIDHNVVLPADFNTLFLFCFLQIVGAVAVKCRGHSVAETIIKLAEIGKSV